MVAIHSFESLRAWQMARDFVKRIYELTENFPEHEQRGLVMQMRNSVVAISSNLSEGSGRMLKKEQARFTQLAYSSLMELLSQVIIAGELNYVSQEKLLQIRQEINGLSIYIHNLRRRQLSCKWKKVLSLQNHSK